MDGIIYRYGLTIIWIFIMSIWFLQAFPKFKNYVKDNPFGDYEQPRTAATFGVLGTFVGIAIGLFLFDTKNIQDSIEKLLSGMETAFITSIIGMITSIYLKNYQFNAQKNYKTEIINYDANISDLIKYLKKSDAEKNNLLEALKNSLAGDGEYTVVGQIKMIRFDMNEKFKNLEKILQDNNEEVLNAFEKFSETLAENNSKIFIEALNETMKDFNEKLTEQFGENFKQFNIAVGRLLQWQENYLQTIEDVTNTLQITFEGIETIKNSVAEIEKSSESMTESSRQIQNLIVTANFYEEKLSEVLKEIQILGDNANISVENLNEKLQETLIRTNSLTNIINNFGNTVLNKISKTTEENISSIDKLSKNVISTSIKQREIMDAEIQSLKDNVEKSAMILRDDTFKITKKVSDALETMMKNNNENLKTATENLNKNLQETLNKSVEEFGNTMYLVSKKFVDDYEPLTEKLAQLVNLAESINRRRLN